MWKMITLLLVGGAILFAAIQLVPYGKNHTNPTVQQEPNWNSSQTRQLAVAACFDCHSNQTQWPWYSNIAPMSWLIQHDVEEGRQVLNFSEWGNRHAEVDDIAEIIQGGEMPPGYYGLLHPAAQLKPSQKQTLIQGMQATFGVTSEGSEREHD
jgi:mono/diheme cytochrome c family protein